MIPKIIHYCWLSEGPLPPSMQKYVDSWKRHMPDYEFRLWNFDRFSKDKCCWVSEAFDNKKFAFAADYIRCYALYHHGGIYFDCDVEALKPFDDLMHLPYAFSFENGTGCVEAGIMASEPGNPIFKRMLDYYEEKVHFSNPDGTFNTTPLPILLRDTGIPPLKITQIKNPKDFNFSDDRLSVLPYDYFSPIHLEHRELQQTSNTYTIHHFAASWVGGWPKYRKMIKRLIGPALTRRCISLKRMLVGKPAKK